MARPTAMVSTSPGGPTISKSTARAYLVNEIRTLAAGRLPSEVRGLSAVVRAGWHQPSNELPGRLRTVAEPVSNSIR
jgi:hypothetical protein